MTPYQSENITELAKALLNVQRTVRPITKDAENPFTKSWYASLNSVMDACRDALIENGIWLCQYPVPVEQPNSLGLLGRSTVAKGRPTGHGIGHDLREEVRSNRHAGHGHGR